MKVATKTTLAEVLSADVLRDILDEDMPVEDIVMRLFQTGHELADAIHTHSHATWEEFKKAHASGESELVQLEGASSIDNDDVVILRGCPMAGEMAKLAVDGKPPAFHTRIVEEYKAQNPGSNSVLHPGCIAHQVARQLIARQIEIDGESCLNYYQLACRSGATGAVVYDDNGLDAIGMTKQQAADLIAGYACLYAIVKTK